MNGFHTNVDPTPWICSTTGSACCNDFSFCCLLKLIVILSVCIQVVALLYYILSYFPGGAQGVKFMLTMFANAMTSCFGSLLKR